MNKIDALGSGGDVGFCFSGVGGEYFEMGLLRYETDKYYRSTFDRLSLTFKTRANIDVRSYLFDRPRFEENYGNMLYSSAATFCTQISLVESFAADGIIPRAMLAHSFGGYAAACAAGGITSEEAISMVLARSSSVEKNCEEVALFAVAATGEVLDDILNSRVDAEVAAINGPEVVIVAAILDHVDMLCRLLDENDIPYIRLPVRYGFHTRWIEPALSSIMDAARALRPQKFYWPVVSSAGIVFIEPTTTFFSTQIRRKINLGEALRIFRSHFSGPCIEIGPDDTLCQRLAKCDAADDNLVLLPALARSPNK